MDTHRFHVSPSHAGERLDRFLEEHLESVSRSRIKRLIQEAHVLLNGEAVKAGYSLKGGEEIHVSVPDPPEVTPQPEDIPVEVVFEDDHLLVVDKPSGMAVHPGAGRSTGTLVNALLGRETPLSTIGRPLRPGIVHRLDKDTSGLMVVAKTDAAHQRLSVDLAERKIQRTYGALAWGMIREDQGTIEAYLGRNPGDRKKMDVVRRGGKPAVTRYRVVWRGDFCTAVRLDLQTGRTHQIRVHLKHLGHPVFGDPDYGGRGKRPDSLIGALRPVAIRALRLLSRQALHAVRLAFLHPVTGEECVFRSPPSKDICGAAAELGVPSRILDSGFLEES